MKKWLPYASIARSIARQWGEVNHTYKTTQQGAYYFSCSGHGGFVIAKDALTQEQLQNLEKIGRLDGSTGSAIYKDWHWYRVRKTGARRMQETEDNFNVEFYDFEEDCNRAIASFVLGINTVDNQENEKLHAEGTMKRRLWKEWEAFTGKTLQPWESVGKDKDVWHEENKDKRLITSAGLTNNSVDLADNEILCFGKVGGHWLHNWEGKYFAIDKDTYNTRKYSYVIGSNPHKEREIVLSLTTA